MARSVTQFLNRNAAVQGLKYSPAVQKNAGGLGEGGFQALGVSPRSAALQDRASETRSRSDNATQMAAQNALNKRVAAEEARVAEQQQKQEAARAEQQKEIERLNAQVTKQQEERKTLSAKPKPEGSADSGYGGIEATGTRAKIVAAAESLIGTPYAWGGGGYKNRGSRGNGKGTSNVIGVDCSGLTQYAYGMVGVKLPRVSDSQLANGVKTSLNKAKPGDLIGWGPGGHVAVYAGNGYIIEAVQPGQKARRRKLSHLDSQRGVFAVSLQLKGE